MGMASGVTAMSVFSMPALVSSWVSMTRERWARNMSSATSSSTTLAAIWKAGMVIPMTLKINCPATEKASRTPAVTQQASPAIRIRCSGVSFGVMVRNAGTVASGSTITNSEPTASRMYSDKPTQMELGTN